MRKAGNAPTAPIHRVISVSWDQATAFDRFTMDFAKWWPRYSLSIGGSRVKNVVFECRAGGEIYEEHHDGTRFRWGTITELDRPRRVSFNWHSSRDESDAQQVEVSFMREGSGTRVELVSRGWEKMGEAASRAHGGYQLSWNAALHTYAARFSATRLFFVVVAAAIDGMGQRKTFVRESRGRMPVTPTKDLVIGGHRG